MCPKPHTKHTYTTHTHPSTHHYILQFYNKRQRRQRINRDEEIERMICILLRERINWKINTKKEPCLTWPYVYWLSQSYNVIWYSSYRDHFVYEEDHFSVSYTYSIRKCLRSCAHTGVACVWSRNMWIQQKWSKTKKIVTQINYTNNQIECWWRVFFVFLLLLTFFSSFIFFSFQSFYYLFQSHMDRWNT